MGYEPVFKSYEIGFIKLECDVAQKAWKHLVGKYLAVFLAFQAASCGTVLHPERRGQPPGRLDPGIVVLDAVGLLLFFIPGVVAFAVDFSNGTIYLPPEGTSFTSSPESQNLQTVQVDPSELTPQRLEGILGKRTGQPICLQPGTYLAARISQIEEFTPMALNRLQAAPVGSNVIFRATAE